MHPRKYHVAIIQILTGLNRKWYLKPVIAPFSSDLLSATLVPKGLRPYVQGDVHLTRCPPNQIEKKTRSSQRPLQHFPHPSPSTKERRRTRRHNNRAILGTIPRAAAHAPSALQQAATHRATHHKAHASPP